jgi:SpoVK/Ycf46/Vps4 family AAA+-type ATPase
LVNVTGPSNNEKHHLGKVLAKEEHAAYIEISLSDLSKRSTKEIEELSKNIQEIC